MEHILLLTSISLLNSQWRVTYWRNIIDEFWFIEIIRIIFNLKNIRFFWKAVLKSCVLWMCIRLIKETGFDSYDPMQLADKATDQICVTGSKKLGIIQTRIFLNCFAVRLVSLS